MHSLRTRLGAVLLVVLAGCPAQDPKPSPAAVDTPAAAAKEEEALPPAPDAEVLATLLQQAAGYPNLGWDTLCASPHLPQLEQVGDTLPLTLLVILGLRFERSGDDQPQGFQVLSEEPAPPNLAAALSRSREEGYVSVLQAEDVTELEVQTTAPGEARGTVRWLVPETWKGEARFVARQVDGAWRIEELELPEVGTVTLQENGWWALTQRGRFLPGE